VCAAALRTRRSLSTCPLLRRCSQQHGATRIRVHILIRSPLPSQRIESYIARSASSKLRSPNLSAQRCRRLNSFFSRFHSQAPRVQTIQRPAARLSSASQERPLRSWFLPLCGHPPRKQTLALGSCLTLAPSGWCALRDSGHQRRFSMYVYVKWNRFLRRVSRSCAFKRSKLNRNRRQPSQASARARTH
jgi:hypothetical protein